MTKDELAEHLRKKGGLHTYWIGSKRWGRKLIDDLVHYLAYRLFRDRRIGLVGWGSFTIKLRKPRKCRHPQTGTIMQLPAKHIIVFKPGHLLSKHLQSLDHEYERIAKWRNRRDS